MLEGKSLEFLGESVFNYTLQEKWGLVFWKLSMEDFTDISGNIIPPEGFSLVIKLPVLYLALNGLSVKQFICLW